MRGHLWLDIHIQNAKLNCHKDQTIGNIEYDGDIAYNKTFSGLIGNRMKNRQVDAKFSDLGWLEGSLLSTVGGMNGVVSSKD